jgi:hypothetical protein
MSFYTQLGGYSNPNRRTQNEALQTFNSSVYNWPYILNQDVPAQSNKNIEHAVYNPVSEYSLWGAQGRAYPFRWNPM